MLVILSLCSYEKNRLLKESSVSILNANFFLHKPPGKKKKRKSKRAPYVKFESTQ